MNFQSKNSAFVKYLNTNKLIYVCRSVVCLISELTLISCDEDNDWNAISEKTKQLLKKIDTFFQEYDEHKNHLTGSDFTAIQIVLQHLSEIEILVIKQYIDTQDPDYFSVYLPIINRLESKTYRDMLDKFDDFPEVAKAYNGFSIFEFEISEEEVLQP